MKKDIYLLEDDIFINEELKILLESFGYNVVGSSFSEPTAIQEIKEMKPTLACLDIDLGDNGSGINVAEACNKLGIPFLFITSFFDEATLLRAKSLDPLAYIVKPFKDSDLKATLSLAFHKIKTAKKPSDNSEIKELFIKMDGDLVKILPQDISYLQGEDNYTHIHLNSGKSTMISTTLKKMEERLMSLGFIRVHKSYLVKLDSISRISGNLLYINEKALPLGNAYRSSLMDKLVII